VLEYENARIFELIIKSIYHCIIKSLFPIFILEAPTHDSFLFWTERQEIAWQAFLAFGPDGARALIIITMINIFRRTRKKMADDNKPIQYVKYAIGEIVLVVIGILIALQLNIANELRQEKKVELNLLNDIKSDLIESQKNIKKTYKSNHNQIVQLKYLAAHISKDLPYTPELDTIFGRFPNWSSPYLTFTSYETLKSKGVDFIQNDDLKKKITDIYESDFANLINDWDKWEWNINQDVVMPFFAENMRSDLDNNTIAVPNDFETLKKDEKFLNILSLIVRTRSIGVEKCLRIDKELDTLIGDISNELNTRNFKN